MSVTADPAPGLYLDNSITVSLSTDPTVITLLADTERPPGLSKIIAYDEFDNPFIVVVEDGRGRVTYDTGFPKFYNTRFDPSWTDRSQLSATFQYLCNVVEWMANPEKVAVGNRNVLLLADRDSTYSINGVSSDFDISIPSSLSAIGYTATPVKTSSFGVPATVPYSTLDQYCCVIIISSYHLAEDRISAEGINNMMAYREAGNGIFVTTDHDVFQGTANLLGAPLGVSFSGTVHRTVGHADYHVANLVANHGNHPIWENITTGYLYANGSEGIATITPSVPYSSPFTLSGPGLRTIYTLTEDDNGVVQTNTLSYAIGVPDPVSGSYPAASTSRPKLLDQLSFSVSRIEDQDTNGLIRRGNNVIGEFSNTGTFDLTYFESDENFHPLSKGVNVFTAQVTVPFAYARTVREVTRATHEVHPYKTTSLLNTSNVNELEPVMTTDLSLSRSAARYAEITEVPRQFRWSTMRADLEEYFRPVG